MPSGGTQKDETQKGERIAKRIARAGVCSRRGAERLIADGRVELDGETVTTPATLVTEASKIVVDGVALPAAEPARLWRYHKPPGVICTSRDPEGRPTVFDRLPGDLPRLILIGRLDLTSEGLLLLTNDGALARRLELPATGWIRRYRVRGFGRPEADSLAALKSGVTVDDTDYGPIEAAIDRIQGDNAWLSVSFREGKNREVRRVMEHLGLRVNRLIRTAFGPFRLDNLPSDGIHEASRKMVSEALGRDAHNDAHNGDHDAHRRR